MPPRTHTELINILEDKIDALEDKHTVLKTRCAYDEHVEDHAKLIQLEERITTVKDMQDKGAVSYEKMSIKLNEASGSLNILADKITDITKESKARSRTVMAIITGIVVTVISGAILLLLTQVITNLQTQADKNVNIEKHLEIMVKEMKNLKNEKTNSN